MAGIATFSTDDSLPTLRAEWLYTHARLLKNPHAKAFAADFEPIGAALDAAITTQGTLDDAGVMAAAGRDAADEGLDPLMTQVLAAILLITKGDRDDPLYLSYGGDQTAAEIIKPILGPELSLAGEWAEALPKESDTTLQAYAAPLSDAVAVGVAAEKEVKATDKALSDFRLLGERKKVVDALNAARAILLGKLTQYRHDHPELRLPASWPTSFFRRWTRTVRFGTTLKQVDTYLQKLEADKAEALAYRGELEKRANEYAKAKADREKARAELAELRAAQKANKAKEKALAAEANKKLKK